MRKVFDKYFYLLFIIFLNLILFKNILLTSLDGTSNIVYQQKHWVFHGGDKAQGFVRLNAGFTILPSKTALLDTFITVSGPIDLRETGTIDLLSDLFLEPSVTLSAGGYINGRGHSIILSGDLTIPSSKVLHIRGNTIIDGNGNNLIVSNQGQIFVDTDVTLTLKNLKFKNINNNVNYPPLRLGSLYSKLALQDVEFAPVNDFLFSQGQIFIHNDTLFTGTSAFIYQSTQPTFITPNSCLYFDKNTTFSFVPASTNKDLIIMQDKTSKIFFDGCELKSTYTGLRLTTGTIYLDNKVYLDSTISVSLQNVLGTPIKYDYASSSLISVNGLAWSPDGKYLAAVLTSSIDFLSFNGSSLNFVNNIYVNGTSHSIAKGDFSGDGKYLLTYGSFTGPAIFKYANSYPYLSNELDYPGWQYAYACSWSPDGKYIIQAPYNAKTNYTRIYMFDGVKTDYIATSTYSFPHNNSSVSSAFYWRAAWHPNGKNIALSGTFVDAGWNYTEILKFENSQLSWVSEYFSNTGFANMSWSPDGKYLAATFNYYGVIIFSFNGLSLTQVCSFNIGGQYGRGIEWSPDGNYLAVALNTGFYILKFTGSSLTRLKYVLITAGATDVSFAWHPSGKFLAVSAKYDPTDTNQEIFVYPLNFGKDPNSQAMSNSIVFGNSSKGSSANLDVNIGSAAFISLTGQLNDDCV